MPSFLGPIGLVPPAEHEEMYYQSQEGSIKKPDSNKTVSDKAGAVQLCHRSGHLYVSW